MSEIALNNFARAQAVLESTLHGHDSGAIVDASERFLAAIYEVRAVGAWLGHPELAKTAAEMLGRVEIAQQRVKNLTRETRERLAAMESAHPLPSVSLYGRVRRGTL